MLRRFFGNGNFFQILLKYDVDLAEAERLKGCGECGERLHRADYPRKPRGAWLGCDSFDCRRFSFCCVECRKRSTPPSFRFFGRRVYFGAVVVLISAMLYGASPRRVRSLQSICGADRRTLMRWRQWWLKVFPRTEVWRTVADRLALVDPSLAAIPRLLLRSRVGSLWDQVIGVLRLLLPMVPLSRRGAPG